MNGEHSEYCKRTYPSCLCNTCKHDHKPESTDPCCYAIEELCPIEKCSKYEPEEQNQ